MNRGFFFTCVALVLIEVGCGDDGTGGQGGQGDGGGVDAGGSGAGPPSSCEDGVVQPGELCDDAPTTCGNGVVDPGEICFGNSPSFSAGDHPITHAIGDLNGDGNLDVVVGYGQDASIGVLLGDGAGHLRLFRRYADATKTGRDNIALTDMDGDGDLDVVFNQTGEGFYFTAFENDGQGHFLAVDSLTFGDGPVVGGDFDGDGVGDVVGSPGGEELLLWRGSADGLSDPQSIAVSRSVLFLEAADLDGDGKLDLAAAVPHGASVLLNDGQGSFSETLYEPFSELLEGVTAGDSDGDGDIDLLAVTDAVAGPSSALLVNDGQGTFEVTQGFSDTGSFPALVNVDGDESAEIVAFDIEHTLEVFDIASGYIAEEPTSFIDVPDAAAADLVDMTGDGHPDAVVTSYDFSTVTVLPFDPATSTYRYPNQFDSARYPEKAEPTDVDGDGDEDLVVFGREVMIHLQDGSGFEGVSVPLGDSFDGGAVGDVNGDGLGDVVIHRQDGQLQAFFGSASAPLETSVLSTMPESAPSLLQDLDADGHVDLIATIEDGIRISWGLGDGHFVDSVEHLFDSYVTGIGVFDAGADGDLDIALAYDGATGFIILELDGRSFTRTDESTELHYRAIDFGDVDNDGDLDLAMFQNGNFGGTDLFINDAGTLHRMPTVPGAADFGLLHDVDADGDVDIVTRGTSGTLYIQQNDGNLEFETTVRMYADDAALAFLELNGDGVPDLAAASNDPGKLFVFLSNP
ncbi:MAG: VCBS repeat-containing protein [Polyangiaceae bacterium]|nr:VCBS repeat-containing protein [Polyangiaceae bacterium]